MAVEAVHTDGIYCPLTYKQAIYGPRKQEWFGPAILTLPPGRKAISSKCVFAVKRDENKKYTTAVLYIANSTRPDIFYAVRELSRYSSHPGRIH